MPSLDRLITIRSRTAEVEAPGGGSWRTFGSPIGAGVVRRSMLVDEPGPYLPDEFDAAPFRELTLDSQLAAVFPADAALLEAWLDTQDENPEYYRPEARRLGSRLADDAARTAVSTSLVGTAMVVRGQFFGTVTAAPAVAAASADPLRGRHATDRWDVQIDRDVARFTFFDPTPVLGRQPYLEWTDPRYLWGFLDVVRFYVLSSRAAWCEVVDVVSSDALAIDTETASDIFDQRIDLTVRVRYDPLIAPFSAAVFEGANYNIRSVREETERGRRRFMLLELQRLARAS